MTSTADNKALIIEHYENLRSFALGHQQKHDHRKNEHIRFIRQGMSSWILEEEVKMPINSKFDDTFANINQKNFQSNCEPQIMQTIADILFKKIKENKCYC